MRRRRRQLLLEQRPLMMRMYLHKEEKITIKRKKNASTKKKDIIKNNKEGNKRTSEFGRFKLGRRILSEVARIWGWNINSNKKKDGRRDFKICQKIKGFVLYFLCYFIPFCTYNIFAKKVVDSTKLIIGSQLGALVVVHLPAHGFSLKNSNIGVWTLDYFIRGVSRDVCHQFFFPPLVWQFDFQFFFYVVFNV